MGCVQEATYLRDQTSLQTSLAAGSARPLQKLHVSCSLRANWDLLSCMMNDCRGAGQGVAQSQSGFAFMHDE